MSNRLGPLAGAALVALGMGTASAEAIYLESVNVNWTSATGGTNVEFNVLTGDSIEVRWGDGQGGLGFAPAAPPQQQADCQPVRDRHLHPLEPIG
jgi:hypothetical protein